MNPKSPEFPENIAESNEEVAEMSPEDYAEMSDQIPMLRQMRKERQDELDLLGENTTEIELQTRLKNEIEELGAEIEGREELEMLPPTKEEVVRALDENGIEDPETKALLLKIIDVYQKEADDKAKADHESSESARRANIECSIKVAEIYLATEQYRQEGIDSLGHTLQNEYFENMEDLAERIEDLLDGK